MPEPISETPRLDTCGWSSFRPELFLNEPGRKSRDVDAAFLALLRDFCSGERVLELCCGAGKLLVHLARSGYETVGLDLSPEMLDICRREVSREGVDVQARIRLIQGDMCSFDLRQAFDFIVLEDDGFVYLLTQEDQIRCLSRVRRHLADGGYFFLSFTTPDRELAATGGFDYDPITQVKTAPNRWAVADAQGKLTVVEEGFERRKLTYPCELELLLQLAGLEAVYRWGDLDRTPFSEPSTQEYHYLIRNS